MSFSDASVRSSWARIDAWLRRHAPASFAELAPGASADEIESAQAQLGLRFPAELLESLACHNGAEKYSGVLPAGAPLGSAEAVDVWQMRMRLSGEDEEPGGSDGEPWWHCKWIPWSETDGDVQVIDMRVGPDRGRIGWAVRDDCGRFGEGWGWSSLGTYLHEVAETLEVGGTVGDLGPYLTSESKLIWLPPDEAEYWELAPTPVSRDA
ncbi:SMI1/KNR4 family protein [Streptomyces sp. NPDC046977]|uniref:SMI1/KNR4 family protein n=1 Tax=Streptomyces sp. NPDC046977 TaxID=3154703 RepID=UPI003405BDA8